MSPHEQQRDGEGFRCIDPRLGREILRLDEADLDSRLRSELEAHLGLCHACRTLRELETAVHAGLDRGDFGPRARRPLWRRGSAWLASGAALLLASVLALMGPETSVSFVPGMGFIENTGQVEGPARYFTVGSHGSVYFLDDAVVFDLRALDQDSLLMEEYNYILNIGREELMERGCAIWLHFDGADHRARLEARERLATRHHFYRGNNPAAWRLDRRAFGELIYHDLWPGVDLVFREESGRISYELRGRRAAAMGRPPFRVEGAGAETWDAERGERTLATPIGDFVELTPNARRTRGLFIWSEAQDSPAFEASDANASADRLLISSFIGGYEFKVGTSVALDPEDDVVIGGLMASMRLPERPGFHEAKQMIGHADCFVAKLSADGHRLLWCAYLGGRGDIESVHHVETRADGAIVIGGKTNASDFPVTAGAFDTSYNTVQDTVFGYAAYDGFVAVLSPDGDRLLASTYLGGRGKDLIQELALGEDGAVYLAGGTTSRNFPVTSGAWQALRDLREVRYSDLFAAKLSPDLSTLEWCTSVGDTAQDQGTGIAVSGDVVYVSGMTGSRRFPTTAGAAQTGFGGGRYDCLAISLDARHGTLRWSSFLGGEGAWDYAFAVKADAEGDAIFTGTTFSEDFPVTSDAYDGSYNMTVEKGGNDIFVDVLARADGALIYGSFIGGGHTEFAQDMELGPDGCVYLVGHTASADFPAVGRSFDRDHNGGSFDAFLLCFDWRRGEIREASFIGGQGDDWGWNVALDSRGQPVVLGQTSSLDFPTTPGAYDRIPNRSLYDIFVLKLRAGS